MCEFCSPPPWEEHFKGKRDLDWETANTPSTRMWLGNIASHVTVEGLFEVFNKFGELTDGAVFPARIGPLGYAFLNFRYVEDAVRAYEALNNHCVPALSASKLLKLRFKPAQVPFPYLQSHSHVSLPLLSLAVRHERGICYPHSHHLNISFVSFSTPACERAQLHGWSGLLSYMSREFLILHILKLCKPVKCLGCAAESEDG